MIPIKVFQERLQDIGGIHMSTTNTDIINAIQLNNSILLEILKEIKSFKDSQNTYYTKEDKRNDKVLKEF